MKPRHIKSWCVAGVACATVLALSSMQPPAQAEEPTPPEYISVDSIDSDGWTTPSDTPASPFIEPDGTFHFEQAHANYGPEDHLREWQFYTGTNMDDATLDTTISNAGTNPDTTELCNTSPTGKESTSAPAGSSYAHPNYCDLTNMWVDPDTGDWYGLVHNEFTPQPFGDGLHFDSIDYAVSHDKGLTWTIPGHAITSPYSTKRGDTEAFPEDTYYYGDGDPRLFVDYGSGYFYAFYGSRVVDKGGSWVAFHEHVARAPISEKMATGSWQKWYDGTWEQPGIGGKESNMVPMDAEDATGYTDPADEYKPTTPGSAAEQIQKGLMPATSPLFVMDVSYNAYLGLYIGQPQNPDQSGNAPQEFYATDNLATQKWYYLGNSGNYTNASWYRWFIDTANKTNSSYLGKDFRSYCSFGCSAEYDENNWQDWYQKLINLTINYEGTPLMDFSKEYSIANGDELFLAVSSDQHTVVGTEKITGDTCAWKFNATGDGAFTITNRAGQALGVDSTTKAGRAWDAALTLADPIENNVGQQWFIIPSSDATTGELTGEIRLINRYSTLALGLSDGNALTTPQRSWDQPTATTTALNTVAAQTLVPMEYVEPAAVTPAEVTFADQGTTQTYTIPSTTGVEYTVDGKAVTAGTYNAKPGQEVTVTAKATGEDANGYPYALAEGATASWSHTFAEKATEQPGSEEPTATTSQSPKEKGQTQGSEKGSQKKESTIPKTGATVSGLAFAAIALAAAGGIAMRRKH